MHSLQFKIHDFRYKVDYLKTRYKQRYYSNDKNPRVIQTKLKNQRLLSLRTQPHDKYFIKPGEFLALVPKKLDKNANHIIELNTSNYLKPQFLKRKELFQWYDDNALKEYSYSRSDLDLEHYKFGKIRSYSNSCIDIRTPIQHGYFDRRLSLSSDGSSVLHSKTSIINRSSEVHYMEVSSNTLPLIDMNSFTPDTRITNISNEYSEKGLSLPFDNPDHYYSKKDQFLGSPKIQSNSPRLQSCHTKERTCNNTNNIGKLQSSWRMVLNAISLSAAMVSVGQSPMHDFEDLTADFTNLKSPKYYNDRDIQNSSEDKENDSSRFGKDGWKKRNSNQAKFTDGNILLHPTINSIDQSHYYNAGGILSMYNYSSGNDSTI